MVTITDLCKSLGLNQKIQQEAETKLLAMGINLNNPNDVQHGITSLVGKVQPFIGLAMPLLRKVSPKIQHATGYSVDELFGVLNGIGNNPNSRPPYNSSHQNIYSKYQNL